MSRLESGLIQPRLDWCDVEDLMRTVVRKMKPDLEGHSVAVSVPHGLPLVRIDFGLMEQVLVNLLRNAASYTPPESSIELSAAMEADQCVLIVADNGPGFPGESLKRVFDKFYRVPGSRSGGTGLGLSIARGFVEAHKGTIGVENRPGGGAQFTIRLPAPSLPPPVKSDGD
jgi:two-component system sensor histidine kinase KdpD